VSKSLRDTYVFDRFKLRNMIRERNMNKKYLIHRIFVIASLVLSTFLGQVSAAMAVQASSETFSDVPSTYWAYTYIEQLYSAGITAGCSVTPLNYCPDHTVTRAQMAVFLLRSKYGASYTPPAVGVGTGFGDVPSDYWAASFIKQLVAEGITVGCGNGNYCPEQPVTRAQMAVFLLRAKQGSAYAPPAPSGVFTDVPVGFWADRWIEQLAVEGITGGCGTNIYCPDTGVTRAQMAVFLVRTFNLPIGILSPILSLTTKVLPSTTTQHLSSVSSDGAVFTFAQTTPALSELLPGQIIVGNSNPAAPYGFLRKVTSVSNSGGQVVVQTSPAAIDEAVQQGEVSITQTLSPQSPASATFADGVQFMESAAAPNSFSLQLTNVVLYDGDGNENTTNDQVNANGSVSLVPRFNFRLKVQDYQLKEFYYTMTASQTTQLKISSKVSVTARAEKILATYPMGPLFLTIGTFPVTVYPVVTIVAGMDGTISANVSTGVTQTLSETAGVSYANNSWSPIQQFSNQFQYDAPTLTAGLSIKGYTGAKLKLLLYGAVGPDISLNAYLKLEANPLQTPWWKLYGGLEVPVGISIEIFSHVIAGYSAVVIDYRILLAQATSSTNNLAPNPSFEEGGSQPSGWASYLGGATYTWSATNAHTGSHSICISNMSASTSGEWESQPIPVQPNKRYNASIWVKGDSDREAYYMIVPKDANGNWIYASSIYIPYNNSSWTFGSFVYTPPANAVSVTLSPGYNNPGGFSSASICFDDVIFQEDPVP
jgi:hypothetical protein